MRPPLEGEPFEVVVIGGGIAGVAIARECARGGKRTLIVEQNDFAAGTTSRSTRIIHGGLRYLEHGEIGLVRESLREREHLRAQYPHLVRPMNFLLAVAAGSRRSALEIRTGLWLYRNLARQKTNFNPETDIRRLEALLDSGRRWTVFHYDDAQCEFPERMVAEWLGEAVAAGAVARNHSSVLEVEIRNGRACAALVRDEFTGGEERIAARWFVNATGPWADRVCQQSGIRTEQAMIAGVRGSHLVLPRFPGAPDSAVYTEASDGRPIFLVPWNGQILVGTTEVRDAGDPARAQPSDSEIEYLFGSVQKLFPGAQISWNEVRYSFAGVRALPVTPGQALAAMTRRHMLHDHRDEGTAGMISVIGGKLTTAAALGRECARKIGVRVAEPVAVSIPLTPADGVCSTFRQWARQIAAIAPISEASAHGLAEWHCRRALVLARMAARNPQMRARLCEHSDHLVAEAVDAMQSEGALTLADVLLRRVPVALGACWSEQCSREAASRIGRAAGWSEMEIESERENFERERDLFLHKPRLLSAQQAGGSGQRAERAT